MLVPSRVPRLTSTTIVKVAEAPEARLDVVQAMVPVRIPLIGGLVQPQPAAPEFETNFVLLGTASLMLTSVALDEPLLVTTTV